jgi:hypothetical protein
VLVVASFEGKLYDTPLFHYNLFDSVDTQATCGFLLEFLDRFQGGN